MLLVSTTPPPLSQIPVRISHMEDERGEQLQSLVKENSEIAETAFLETVNLTLRL